MITPNYHAKEPISLTVWPHNLSTNRATLIASLICVGQLAILGGAAYLDDSLWLPGDGVGLLKHPGMLAIILGDLLLVILSSRCAAMSAKIGHKLPTTNKSLCRRYFRVYIWRNVYFGRYLFFKSFIFLSLVGFLFLIDQTVKLFDPLKYYGHDTFDSFAHLYSFMANRFVLFVSWCVIIPMFCSYFLIHTMSIRLYLRKCRKRRALCFYINHPDRCGGYAFFGWMDAFYTCGLLVVFLEALVLVFTHKKIEITNILAILGITVGFLIISIFSIYEVFIAIKEEERRLKSSYAAKYLLGKRRITLDYYTLLYGVKFSPYNAVALQISAVTRSMAAVPLVYKAFEYLRTIYA